MKLKIGPLTFDVVYEAPEAGASALGEEYNPEEPYWGAINHHDQIIVVNKENTEERAKLALLHESLHAIDSQYDIGLSEGQVRCLATGLLDLFGRNRWFGKKICGS